MAKAKNYGGAHTNQRIIDIRKVCDLSRAELAKITGYSHTYVDNWLAPVKSKNWRVAPESAVRLAELELGLRKPKWLPKHRALYRRTRGWPS